jgi:DNA polymerase
MSHADGKINLNGKEYTVVTVDYETYFDQEYTLSKSMNTSEYVRDERFEAYLVGIKIGSGPTQIFTETDVIPALKRIDWSTHAFLAHNTQFDGLITIEPLGINPPGLWLDTLAMARACLPHTKNHKLDTVAKYFGLAGKVKASALQNMKGVCDYTPEMLAACGEYCVDDVEMCYDIFWKMYDAIPDKELRLIHETTRMFCQGQALVDVDRVRTELERELAHKAQALSKVGLPISTLMSNDSLASAIRDRGVEPPTKISPTTGKETYAFAKSDLEFQALETDPRVADLIAARLAVKSTLGETRAGRFINAGTTGKLPVGLNFYGAQTGRWSGGNTMNLQNLPRGSELRRSIIAPPGHKIVVCDSSQIEARVLAWLAGQESLLEQFRNKADIYSAFASIVYGRPVDRKRYDEHGNKPDELEGMVGKVCILGLGYQMGAAKLQDTFAKGMMGPKVEFTLDQCRHFVNTYRSANYMVAALWQKMDHILRAASVGQEGTYKCLSWGKDYIRLPNGMFLHYPALTVSENDQIEYYNKYGISYIYGGLATENAVQALARIIVAEQMLDIIDADPDYNVMTMTHDEVVVICPDEKVDTCLDDMLRIMRTPPTWASDLPLDAEGGYAQDYSK